MAIDDSDTPKVAIIYLGWCNRDGSKPCKVVGAVRFPPVSLIFLAAKSQGYLACIPLFDGQL
jgi:hypothetical protein